MRRARGNCCENEEGDHQGFMPVDTPSRALPFPFDKMDTLLRHGKESGLSIAAMMEASRAIMFD